MLVRWLKKALPDAHCVIFDFHVEIAYQETREKIGRVINPQSTLTYNTINKNSLSLFGNVTEAVNIGSIVYLSADRPHLKIYREFIACYQRIWDADSRKMNERYIDRVNHLYDRLQEEYEENERICKIISMF